MDTIAEQKDSDGTGMVVNKPTQVDTMLEQTTENTMTDGSRKDVDLPNVPEWLQLLQNKTNQKALLFCSKNTHK